MTALSLVVPCYNEEKTIPLFYREVLKYEDAIGANLEFWFVDDGSEDGTLRALRDLANEDERVHYVSLSRNFGKESALLAGLEAAGGDFVTTMDVDLQDPPSLLPEMLRIAASEGSPYDCVATRRSTREGEPMVRSFFSRLFYKIINGVSKTEIVDGARDFRLMSRPMVDAIIADREYNRFSKGIFSWVGFDTKWLEYENVKRSAGESKWSFWKLMAYALDGIIAYSAFPLYAASVTGVVLFLISTIALATLVIRALLFGDSVSGWPSLMSAMTFIGGLTLMGLGVVGLYISKIYLEVKDRPLYIVREKR